VKILFLKLKTILKKEVLPLEVFVIDTIRKKNMSMNPNARFSYNGELREIDVHCFFTDSNLDGHTKRRIPLLVRSSLIVECKKSDKPWIFFHPEQKKYSELFTHIAYVSSLDPYFRREGYVDTVNHLKLFTDKRIKLHYENESIPECISYVEAFRDPNKELDIFKAIQSVQRYTENEQKKQRAYIDAEGERCCSVRFLLSSG